MKKPIFVCGYPKSGNTYLTRLIAEILDSPSGGSIPSEDSKELATEGLDRTGDYIVRKGHYRIVDTFVGKAHTIDKEQISNNPVFFIVRDPRDIVVSAAYFHSKSFEDIAKGMVSGKLYGLGRWDDYVQSFYLNKLVYGLRYEDLLENTALEIRQGLLWHGILFNKRKVSQSIQNQSFNTVKKRYANNSLNNKLMRNGKSGDWKSQLSKNMVQLIESEFSETMRYLGYEIS